MSFLKLRLIKRLKFFIEIHNIFKFNLRFLYISQKVLNYTDKIFNC